MLKQTFAAMALSALLFTSCDVRKTDKLADNVAKDTTQNTANFDPTQVQMVDSSYNFGKISEGEVVEYSFRFKNVGNKPLVVKNASASCGCTVPEKPEQPIMPGELGSIRVKFNSEGKPGTAHKTVNISSNAQPEFPVLALIGEVTPKQ